MTWNDEMACCDGCGVEITWGGVVIEKRTYCCQDCALGSPCQCGDRMEIDDERRNTAAASATTSGYLA